MSEALRRAYAASTVSKRERYGRLRTSLWSTRASFDSHWREIADFLLPRRTRFQVSDRNRGDRRNQNIINSTGTFSIRTLQSGLHAGLTSPARPWFKLTTPDPELAKFPPVKRWLHESTRRMQDVFAQTNLYNSLPICYGDMGTFGTHAMAVLEDEVELFRTYPFAIGTYALGLDRRGKVTTFVRDYQLTVRQVVEEFGVTRGYRDIDWDRISIGVKDAWDKGDYENPVDLTWIVLPNVDRDDERIGSQYLPFASCHFETGEPRDGRGFLRESGFRSFPILAPRWDVTDGDSYGTDCPGMTALGDVKQLQSQERTKGKAMVKMVDPPMVGPTSLMTQKTSLLPGDVTYQDVREGMKGFQPAHEVRIDLSHLTVDIGKVEYRIQRAFYEDLFLMLAHSDESLGADRPTAREVQERHEEKLLALGPVLERTNDELLDPLIDRAFELMEVGGLIDDPPDELDGVKLKIEYISIMAEAQKLVAVVAQDRFVASVLPLAEVAPETVDKVDYLQIVENYGDMLGADPRILRTNEEAQARAQERAQAQQAAMAADNAQKMASAAKDASQTPMGGDTALTRLTTAMGGA